MLLLTTGTLKSDFSVGGGAESLYSICSILYDSYAVKHRI